MKTIKIEHFYRFRNPKRISKKAQITTFVFLGVVLLIIAGFTMYIVNYTVKKQAQREVKTTQKQESRTEAIESYIITCVEKSIKKGLKLIGNQGGVIYKDQGGLTQPAPENYLTKDTTKIQYGIKEPVAATCNSGDGCLADCDADPDCIVTVCGRDGFCVIGCNSADPDCGSSMSTTCNSGDGCNSGCSSPDPDCGGATCNAGDNCVTGCTPKDPDCSIYTCDDDGMCVLGCSPVDSDCAKNDNRGFNTIAPLYPWKCFSKSIGCTLPTRYTGYLGITTLPPLEGINSIKSQLNEFVKTDITSCIDLSIFEEQGFDIIAGTLSTEIAITEKAVIATLNYPLSVKHFRTGEKASLKKFSYNARVNLRGIHNYSNYLITEDTTNIKFNPGSQSKDSFSVSVDRLTSNDIISVTDSGSSIDGAVYQFKFARKNRRPALETLNTISLNLDSAADDLFNAIIGTSNIHDPDEDIDCSSYTGMVCDGPGCLLIDCTYGSIKAACPTILDFKSKNEIGGPITANKPNQDPEVCNVTISDDFLEDYNEDIKVQIIDAS